MTREEIIRNLQYTMEKHKNDTVPTFGTNISLMCKDILDYLEREPCEDAISRESTMLRIREFIGNPTYTEKMLVDDMNALPSVQPKYNTSEWCHDCSEYDHDKHCCPRYNKVIRNAVEEMKQETCDDTVSRQAAIDALSHMCSEDENGITVSRANVNSMLRVLPPVTPQLKTGHWIYEKRKRLINETDEGAEYVTDYWCKCSNCNGDFGYRKMKDAFCKYCGARMIESQESEDKECR